MISPEDISVLTDRVSNWAVHQRTEVLVLIAVAMSLTVFLVRSETRNEKLQDALITCHEHNAQMYRDERNKK